MKLHLRGDSANGEHTRFTIFMNGANCGQLCMKEEEALYFYQTILVSKWHQETDEVRFSGTWIANQHQEELP